MTKQISENDLSPEVVKLANSMLFSPPVKEKIRELTKKGFKEMSYTAGAKEVNSVASDMIKEWKSLNMGFNNTTIYGFNKVGAVLICPSEERKEFFTLVILDTNYNKFN